MTEVNEKLLETLGYDSIRRIVSGYCCSPLGRNVALRMEPLDHLEKARRALKQVEEMRRYLQGGAGLGFSGLTDVVSLIQSALENNKTLEPKHLYSTLLFLSSVRRMGRDLGARKEEFFELGELLSRLVDLADLEGELARTVDAGGEVLNTASPRLSELRGKMERLSAEIRREAESFLGRTEIARFLQDAHIRIRTGRLVLSVRTEHRKQIRGIVHGYSASGGTAFIEPEMLIEKQDGLEKLRLQESREVARILWDRTRRLIDRLEEIRANQRIAAWIDFTYARACYARDFDLQAPRLEREGSLDLREARHPLLLEIHFRRIEGDLEVKRSTALHQVIPLDLHLGSRFDILVVTGPNTGGKTVTLKTTGLLALMAVSGLPVPAASGTTIPFYSRVLADIGDEQDLSQNLSTFSSHMMRISEILERADASSLVLLDELGTGTDPLEGEALGRAILKHLLKAGTKVLVSTHLSKLKEFAFSLPRVENACMEFDPDTLRPTFHLRIGMPGESNAIKIARRLGIPAAILEEAGRALEDGERDLKRLMDEVQRIRIQSEQTLGSTRRKAREIEQMMEEAQSREEEIAQRRAMLQEEAEREIDLQLRKSIEGVEEPLRKLRNSPEPFKKAVHDLEAALREMVNRSPLGERRLRFIEGLKKGDMVYIPRYREKCQVLKIRKKEETIEVLYRNLQVSVPFHEVMWPHWY